MIVSSYSVIRDFLVQYDGHQLCVKGNPQEVCVLVLYYCRMQPLYHFRARPFPRTFLQEIYLRLQELRVELLANLPY